jgi:hypothetical protein
MSGGEADLAAHGHRIDMPEMCVCSATAPLQGTGHAGARRAAQRQSRRVSTDSIAAGLAPVAS